MAGRRAKESLSNRISVQYTVTAPYVGIKPFSHDLVSWLLVYIQVSHSLSASGLCVSSKTYIFPPAVSIEILSSWDNEGVDGPRTHCWMLIIVHFWKSYAWEMLWYGINQSLEEFMIVQKDLCLFEIRYTPTKKERIVLCLRNWLKKVHVLLNLVNSSWEVTK